MIYREPSNTQTIIEKILRSTDALQTNIHGLSDDNIQLIEDHLSDIHTWVSNGNSLSKPEKDSLQLLNRFLTPEIIDTFSDESKSLLQVNNQDFSEA